MRMAVSPPVLGLDGFGFAFGERTVVRALDLAVSPRGLTTLLGPVSAGKTSLLRLLSGHISPGGHCQVWGEARYAGAPLGERGRPALASLRARLLIGTIFEKIADGLPDRGRRTRPEQREIIEGALCHLGLSSLAPRLDSPVIELSTAEQRCVAMIGAWVGGSEVLCFDEPTAGLDDDGRRQVLALVERAASERAVLFVTHNLNDVRALGGEVALLAGGVLRERCPASRFLREPLSAAGRRFLETGSCSVPSPDSVAEELDPAALDAMADDIPEPAGRARLAPPSATPIRWVIPGLLAGVSRPGLLRELEADLSALAAASVRWLLCLEESRPIPEEAIAASGIQPLWQPIPDMRAPTLAAACQLCEAIDERLRRGEAVAVHCRGGLGRTGTVLAAHFIWRGASAPEALSMVRRVEPRFVQSTEQIDFLRCFAAVNRGRSGISPSGRAAADQDMTGVDGRC